VRLVPVTARHVPELRRILRTPEVRLRWGDEAASPGWPFDDPSEFRFAVLLDGEVCGMIQYGEEEEPGYRHASIDIFLEPGRHGRGLGRDAVGTLARHLVHERGHHRLVIDPAADNEPPGPSRQGRTTAAARSRLEDDRASAARAVGAAARAAQLLAAALSRAAGGVSGPAPEESSSIMPCGPSMW